MISVQCYATLADLAADLESGNFPADALGRFLLPASDYIREAVGSFIPETKTLKMRGKATAPTLLFTAPLLNPTAIINGGITLAAADYVLKPEARHWPDGPYSWLEIPETAQNHTIWAYWLAEGVEISGLWGMYNKTKASGATLAAQQLDTAGTLQVDDGGKLSPGNLVLIESEQQFIDGYSSPATATTLAAAVDGSTEELSLVNGALVKVGEQARLDFELVLVLTIQGNKAQVVRGWGATKKTSHSTGTNVEAYRTYTVQRGVNGTSAATHAQGLAAQVYQVPAQVNYMTRQVAILMMKKAESGYAGKTGNEALGTTFYFHEFPRDELDRVKRNYYIPRGG